jgi:glycosyltransferase involved in cell wall biosynthesis
MRFATSSQQSGGLITFITGSVHGRTYLEAFGMRFSLIVATVNRTDQLERLLRSLASQSFTSFQVILVDQNTDDRVKIIADAFSDRMTILRLQSEKGISRARNRGLPEATGEIVAFPDDDCWYSSDVLERVDAWFSGHPDFAFLSTCATDTDGNFVAGRWLPHSAEINRTNVFRTHISFSLFFRQDVIRAVRGFDEQLGLGGKIGSEETDCVLRVMSMGNRGWYERSLAVYHPARVFDASPAVRDRAFTDGLGFGYLLRRHRIPFSFALYLCIRPAGGWLLNVFRRGPLGRVYLATLLGRLEGYFGPQSRLSSPVLMD